MPSCLDIDLGLASWFLVRRFDQTTQSADRLFREFCADLVLVEYMVSLPLGRLQGIRRALSIHSAQQGEEALEDVVRAAIARDWRQLSSVQVDYAVDVYVCCLRCALLPRCLVPLTPAELSGENSRVF